MKKFVVFLLISMISIGIYAQEINGIGKLRLNMTIKEVRAVFPKSLIKKETVFSNKKAYKIRSYTPVKGVTCRDIDLYFYKDTLYAIYINKGDYFLEQAMFKKYGEPRSRVSRYPSIYEELIAIYGSDATDYTADYLKGKRPKKQNIRDLYYEWNPGNPFCRSYFFSCLFDNSKGESDIEYIFCFKNEATARVAELEEELERIEKEKKDEKDLEDL